MGQDEEGGVEDGGRLLEIAGVSSEKMWCVCVREFKNIHSDSRGYAKGHTHTHLARLLAKEESVI